MTLDPTKLMNSQECRFLKDIKQWRRKNISWEKYTKKLVWRNKAR